MSTKAQVTLFVIIGFLFLIGALFLIFINSEDTSFKNYFINSVKDSEERGFEDYVRTCVDRQIYYNLQQMFSNLYSTVYIHNYLPVALVGGKPVIPTKILDETLVFYEKKLNIILKNSYCLQNIPSEFVYSHVNVQNTKVKLFANDSFIVETSIDGWTKKDDSITKLPTLRKNYGNLYKSDFQITITSYIISSLLCESTICFPKIAYLLPSEMNITLSYMGVNHTNLVVTRENAIVADKEVQFNIELIKR